MFIISSQLSALNTKLSSNLYKNLNQFLRGRGEVSVETAHCSRAGSSVEGGGVGHVVEEGVELVPVLHHHVLHYLLRGHYRFNQAKYLYNYCLIRLLLIGSG